ncbi:hypothetical protein BKA80DRAFT_46357 [Phyllosticta citrichinensis]
MQTVQSARYTTLTQPRVAPSPSRLPLDRRNARWRVAIRCATACLHLILARRLSLAGLPRRPFSITTTSRALRSVLKPNRGDADDYQTSVRRKPTSAFRFEFSPDESLKLKFTQGRAFALSRLHVHVASWAIQPPARFAIWNSHGQPGSIRTKPRHSRAHAY